MKNNPIGVIDSGIGGLSVLKRLEKLLPSEDYIYVCDEKNVPYGKKSSLKIRQLTWKMIRFLESKKIKAVVIGCNTITAVMLNEIRHKLSCPVYGVIYPGCESALANTKNKRIGVIGTNATIRLNAYADQLKKMSPKINVFQLECQSFVKIAENLPTTTVERQMITKKLTYFYSKRIDTLILGCTHFPLIYPEINKSLSSKIKIIDPALETAIQVKADLCKKGLLKKQQSKVVFYTSGKLEHFKYSASEWLNKQKLNVQEVVY